MEGGRNQCQTTRINYQRRLQANQQKIGIEKWWLQLGGLKTSWGKREQHELGMGMGCNLYWWRWRWRFPLSCLVQWPVDGLLGQVGTSAFCRCSSWSALRSTPVIDVVCSRSCCQSGSMLWREEGGQDRGNRILLQMSNFSRAKGSKIEAAHPCSVQSPARTYGAVGAAN